MDKELPDVHIRDAIAQAIDGTVVNGVPIETYDTVVFGPDPPDFYVLMTTQSSAVEKSNKCEYYWLSSILLDVTSIYHKPGNSGSRFMVDSITDMVRALTRDLQLDPASGMEIITIVQTFPSDLFTATKAENVFRKFVRLELTIK